MREAWGIVNSPEVKVPSLGSVDYHWIDNQSRWSAGMWYTPLWNYLSPGWKRDGAASRDETAHKESQAAQSGQGMQSLRWYRLRRCAG